MKFKKIRPGSFELSLILIVSRNLNPLFLINCMFEACYVLLVPLLGSFAHLFRCFRSINGTRILFKSFGAVFPPISGMRIHHYFWSNPISLNRYTIKRTLFSFIPRNSPLKFILRFILQRVLNGLPNV